MKLSTFELMRIWGVVTGLVLAAWFFFDFATGVALTDTLPMLIAGIGGFELVLCAQDAWLKRRRING